MPVQKISPGACNKTLLQGSRSKRRGAGARFQHELQTCSNQITTMRLVGHDRESRTVPRPLLTEEADHPEQHHNTTGARGDISPPKHHRETTETTRRPRGHRRGQLGCRKTTRITIGKPTDLDRDNLCRALAKQSWEPGCCRDTCRWGIRAHT